MTRPPTSVRKKHGVPREGHINQNKWVSGPRSAPKPACTTVQMRRLVRETTTTTIRSLPEQVQRLNGSTGVECEPGKL